jgi:hypothetical protein
MSIDVDRVTMDQLNAETRRLVEAWCDRRCLAALRWALSGWPLANNLTDDWQTFMNAMKNVRAYASPQLTDTEREMVDDLIRAAERAVYRR